MTTDSGAGRPVEENADFSWDDFDSAAYVDHNYGLLRNDDLQILTAVRDFFAGAEVVNAARGLDVGSGTNLYPALAMLPFCEDITLWEHSASNVLWLENEVPHYSSSWDAFWEVLRVRAPYRAVGDPRTALAQRTKVRKESIFDLPAGLWDIGTMFFVAESMTTTAREFSEATGRFVRALRPGSPFAAAFMENSSGYKVGDTWFPAYGVTADSVGAELSDKTGGLEVHRIGAPPEGLVRTGYTGMVVALGIVGPD